MQICTKLESNKDWHFHPSEGLFNSKGIFVENKPQPVLGALVLRQTLFMGRTANGKLDEKKCTSNIRQPHWFSRGTACSGSQLTWPRPLGKAWLPDSWTQELLCSIQPHLTLPWASSNASSDGETLWDYKPAQGTKLSDPQLWRKSLNPSPLIQLWFGHI